MYKVWNNATNAWYNDCLVRLYVVNPYIGSNTFESSIAGNGCPANLKLEMGPVVSGSLNSGREFFVYLEGQKARGKAASIGDFSGLAPAMAPAMDEAANMADDVATTVTDAATTAADAAKDAATTAADAAKAASSGIVARVGAVAAAAVVCAALL